jgi:hypothetical protein
LDKSKRFEKQAVKPNILILLHDVGLKRKGVNRLHRTVLNLPLSAFLESSIAFGKAGKIIYIN